MCDFHSCCVRVDGALAHVADNSHSTAAQQAGWMENEPHKRPRFVETEWDGRGTYPGAERIARIQPGEELTAAQRKKIDSHYQALAAFLNNKALTLEDFERWSAKKWNDVTQAFFRGCTGLTKLPDGLTVGGYLDLSGCTGLTKLPDGLTVKESLYLRVCTGLTKLPDGLTVKESLYLRGCTGLTKLPDKIKAKHIYR